MRNSFSLFKTNKPLKDIIIAPIIILKLGISLKKKYPKIIPKTITEYLVDEVNDKGALRTVSTENKYARVKVMLENII